MRCVTRSDARRESSRRAFRENHRRRWCTRQDLRHRDARAGKHSALRAQVRRRRLRDCCRSKALGAVTMAAFVRLLMRNDGAAGRFDLRF